MNYKTTFPDPSLLAHPRIPMPLHGINPRTIMGKAWWDEQRRTAYRAHDYHCWACGQKPDSPLEAHECYNYDEEKGLAILTGVVALCSKCHSFIHDGRLGMLVAEGKLSEEAEQVILERGKKILGSCKKKEIFGREWKLVIDDYAYFSSACDLDLYTKCDSFQFIEISTWKGTMGIVKIKVTELLNLPHSQSP